MAAGQGALLDREYFDSCCKKIIENREYLVEKLKAMGFSMTDSTANFIFAKSDKIPGKELYLKLKEKGVLVRHFDKERLTDFVRITVGNIDEINALLKAIGEII